MPNDRRYPPNSTLPYGTKPLKRTELQRGPGPKRRARIRPVNPERKARLFREQFGSEAKVKWYRAQECRACGAWPSECAHVTSRGAGGTDEDMISLCRKCHRKQHDQGWSAVGIEDPHALATEQHARWLERGQRCS